MHTFAVHICIHKKHWVTMCTCKGATWVWYVCIFCAFMNLINTNMYYRFYKQSRWHLLFHAKSDLDEDKYNLLLIHDTQGISSMASYMYRYIRNMPIWWYILFSFTFSKACVIDNENLTFCVTWHIMNTNSTYTLHVTHSHLKTHLGSSSSKAWIVHF